VALPKISESPTVDVVEASQEICHVLAVRLSICVLGSLFNEFPDLVGDGVSGLPPSVSMNERDRMLSRESLFEAIHLTRTEFQDQSRLFNLQVAGT